MHLFLVDTIQNIVVVQNNVIKDYRHVTILQSSDHSKCVQLLTDMINDSLHSTAPIKKICIKKNMYQDNISKRSKDIIKNIEIQKLYT